MKKLAVLIVLLIPYFCFTQIINVPSDYTTIQDGINAAKDGDTVLVAENTYMENIRFMGKAIMLTSEYILDGDSSHIVNTIIDGGQPDESDSAAVVMFVNGEDTTSILNGFTIKGGEGVYNQAWGVRWGGGIYAWNAGCKIINNIITDNHVSHDNKAGGGGIGCGQDTGEYWTVIRDNYIAYNTSMSRGYSAFAGGISAITNCIIENNLIEHNTCTNTFGIADGGGIEVEAVSGNNPIAYIRGNIIQHNELIAKTGALGAGIRINEVDTEIEDNLFSGNMANGENGGWGGGINAYASVSLTISNNIFEYNSCSGIANQAGGGAINLLKCGKTTIFNNEIYENQVTAGSFAWGAGILIDKAIDSVLINNNIIADNITGGAESGFGGGICFYGTTDIVASIKSNWIINNYAHYRGGGICARNLYRMNIINNFFENNESTNRGGAILFYETSTSVNRDEISHPLIANNTFVNNISNHYAGAVYNGYDLESPIIYNSIFWGNSANSDHDVYNAGSADMELYNNNIDTDNISTNWIGEDNIFEDPLFIKSGDHPYQINDYSPCIDAGADDTIGLNLPEYDLAGEVRFFNDKVDMGAYEWSTFVGVEDFEVQSSKSEVRTYPNPFTFSTTIEYKLKQAETVIVTFYNQFGKQVDMIEEKQQSGINKALWTPENLPDGIYYFRIATGRLDVGEQVASGKVVKVE